MIIGATLVLKTVDALARGEIIPVSQEELITSGTEFKHAPKLFRDDMRINWLKSAVEVRNLIRGLSPYPAAWTTLVKLESGQSTEIKIFYAEMSDGDDAQPGTIFTDGKNYIKAACKNGWIQITDLQLSGKKRMKADEFLRGFQNISGYKFE